MNRLIAIIFVSHFISSCSYFLTDHKNDYLKERQEKSLTLPEDLDTRPIIDFYPKKIVFIDDKEKNIIDMDEKIINYDIEYVGLRYGFLDEKIKNFNRAISNFQLEYFKKILTDEDAEAIIEKRFIGG